MNLYGCRNKKSLTGKPEMDGMKSSVSGLLSEADTGKQEQYARMDQRV